MRIRKHLFCIVGLYSVLGLICLVPGISFFLDYWRDVNTYSGVGEAIALLFAIGGLVMIGISLIYFRVAYVYYRVASGKKRRPGRVAVILSMIIGFPYGTLAGVYALYVRNRYALSQQETEQEDHHINS